MDNQDLKPVEDLELAKFIAYCKEYLGYTMQAIIVISDDHNKAKEIKSMAAYFPNEVKPYIWILRGSRLRADYYRSLAHELVHHKQREDGKVLDGEDGSQTENEANSLAGIILREYGRNNPIIFDQETTP